MIIHPSKHYIYYLISRGGCTPEKVVERLSTLGLPFPPNDPKELQSFSDSVVRAKKALILPPSFRPKDKSHEPSQEYLRKWGIGDAWANDKFMRAARKLLEKPAPRRMLFALLLSPLSEKGVAQRVRSRFGFTEKEVNPRVVRLFSHYFWNYNALDRDQWATIIARWMPGRSDDLMTVLRLPRTKGGVAMALSVADQTGAGSTPATVMYDTIREAAFQMFMSHAVAKPHHMNTLGALQALEMIIKADAELEKHRGGASDLMEEIANIRLIYQGKDPKDASDLYMDHLADDSVIQGLLAEEAEVEK